MPKFGVLSPDAGRKSRKICLSRGPADLRDTIMQHRERRTSKVHDPRWIALDTVQSAQQSLGLRDRDIAVLRALLSFVSADTWDGSLFVFASNSALQERCGGMDERTLRRRLSYLCKVGLIARHQSPNRKRYPVRDSTGMIVLAYGFDLAPLRTALPHLKTLGVAARQEQDEIRLLRRILRDRIFHAVKQGIDCALTGRLLRRKTDVAALRTAIQSVEELTQLQPIAHTPVNETTGLTDSNGQIDRHNQTSKKENYEKKGDEVTSNEISVETCIERLPATVSFAEEAPRTWADLDRLAAQLAPAIGLQPNQLALSHEKMGRRGTTLAVLGLVEAYGRIQNPSRYLHAILQQKRKAGLGLSRMFHALTRQFPAGNQHLSACGV